MATQAIIDVILRTRSLDGTSIGLAAYLANSGFKDCRKDVQDWWVRQGGSVSDPQQG